jgi:hypothetical protein
MLSADSHYPLALGHGSRLGFPGRRQPRDPAASGNVARADTCCLGKQDSRGQAGDFERARGAGPGPGGTWFAGPKAFGPERSAGGGGRPAARETRAARKHRVPPDQPVELFRRGRPTFRALLGSVTMRRAERGGKGAVEPGFLMEDCLRLITRRWGAAENLRAATQRGRKLPPRGYVPTPTRFRES